MSLEKVAETAKVIPVNTKIDCTIPLVNLRGEILEVEGEQVTIGKAISNILINHRGKTLPPEKIWLLSQKLFNENFVELDKSDFHKMKEIINQDQSFGPLVQGQLALYLNELK